MMPWSISLWLSKKQSSILLLSNLKIFLFVIKIFSLFVSCPLKNTLQKLSRINLTKKVRFILSLVEGDVMKHNVLYEDLTFEQVSLLDEACKIYPNLSEVRKKSPSTYKDFEKMYEEMCRKLAPECRSLTHACSIVNLIFRIHGSGINYNNKTKGNIFFIKLILLVFE